MSGGRSSSPLQFDVEFGFIDASVASPRRGHPQLIVNEDPHTMVRAIREELRRSSSFSFSVAFISSGAIAMLKQELVDFVGNGRIVTSNYLGFNEPRAFRELLALRRLGIDVRRHLSDGFHPKGYVFESPDSVTAILGSSNLTKQALATNHEWNLRVTADRGSDLASQLTNLLQVQMDSSVPLTEEWVLEYERQYVRRPAQSSFVPPLDPPERDVDSGVLEPNAMQLVALASLQQERDLGRSRSLIISATGTGKTILSAFDVKSVDPSRMLFIAHREQILDRARIDYQRVLGADDSDFGKIVGSSREADRRYVFATVQTLSRPQTLATIRPATFDYIVIDEVHRAAADGYLRVLEHFAPAFLLGMTATPERTDGADVFEIFDYNVPYEIRLKDALEEGMLAPFHYYGVTDVVFDDGTTASVETSPERLVGRARVDHVVRALETYGQAGVPVRGLIFCSRNEEARGLSEALNSRELHGRNLRTAALSGADSVDERNRMVERLEAGELDYLLTVDIFNEGVDIPTVNQVVMLRQTQSSIVFVQQLGRGLRKAANKDYLVVIDFIGNYANNYLIPIALFGDDSLDRESIRKNLIAAEERGFLPGLSTVRFDKIAQQRVLASLAEAKLDSLPNLKKAIDTVQARIGRRPMLADFLRFESADPVVLATREGSYPALLERLYKDPSELSELPQSVLVRLSCEFLTAKRGHELVLFRALLRGEPMDEAAIEREFDENGLTLSATIAGSTIKSLTGEFNVKQERQKYGPKIATRATESAIVIAAEVLREYERDSGFREHVDDLISTGLDLIGQRYMSRAVFTRASQYTRKDASRLLDWGRNLKGTLNGYHLDQATRTCPIFVTLKKADEVSASTAYKDEIVDTSTMVWYSKNGRTLNSAWERQIAANEVEIHVFAKKNDVDRANHYYLGRANVVEARDSTMPATDGGTHPVVRMVLKFAEPIDNALFDYFHPAVTETS